MENKTETFTVEASLPQERMDVYLKSRFPEQSRGTFQRLIQERYILVDGETIRPTHHPRAGEVVTLCWPAPKPAQAQAEDIPLEILYEDESLLVLNKPAGLCVHPANGHDEHTLVNALLYHCQGQLSGIGGVARPGIVHRLDMDTSGALLVAKDDETHQALTEQFAQRTTEKFYLALLCGNGIAGEGKIEAPIDRSQADRKKMQVSTKPSQGRYALTTYRVMARGEYATLVEAQIHTGRTHQVRVHFKHLGFPLVGDEVYGKRQNSRLKEQARYAVSRQMLHAWKISFTHPRSGERMHFCAPLPEDIRKAAEVFTGWTPSEPV